MGLGAGSVQEARAGVVRRLRARRGELVEAIFSRVRGDAFGVVGAGDSEYVTGLAAAVAAAVEYVLEGVERGEDGVGPIPAVVLEQARRAAHIGVSLETVLRRYVVGHSVLEDFIMDSTLDEKEWTAATQRDALRDALRAQASALDRLLLAVASAYGDELRRAGRSPEQRRAELVRRLLDGATIYGSELDYELDAWHIGVIAMGAGAAQAVRELAAGLDRRLLSVTHAEHGMGGEEGVWTWLGGAERLAPGEVERVMAGTVAGRDGRVTADGVVLALGEPARGLAGWRLTHQQAEAALAVARRRSPRLFTRYGDVMLLASALKDELLARALIEIYIAPLEDARGSGPVLRETLRAYICADCGVASAAAALGVVRKTIENRLRTIETRLGRTLHPCPAEIEVALELLELDEPAGALQPSEVSILPKLSHSLPRQE